MEYDVQDKKESPNFREDKLKIIISPDKMTASLLVDSDVEEGQISREDLDQLISKSGVKYGIIDAQLQLFLEDYTSYYHRPLIFAEGKAAIDGQDAYMEMIFDAKQDAKPKEQEDGSVDFYNIRQLSNIEKGQLIAKKIPPTTGVDGINVLNQPIQAKHGRDISIKIGKNTVIDKASQAVYALVSGQVSITENDKINVFPVFEVNGDLDFSVGNIDFVGNVLIRGNVPTGFKVKAKGDIQITGGVEGAELEAEGSIMINSGIMAMNKGLIKAGQDLRTSFIVNGSIQVQGDVIVNQSIMHSEVIAGGTITCNGPKGLIVGGTLQAGRSVICKTIGNMMNTQTSLEIGMNPNLLNRLREVEHELGQLKDSLSKSEQALKILDETLKLEGNLPAGKRELQIKLTNNKLSTEKKIKTLSEEYIELEIELENDKRAALEVHHIIHPGTRIIMGKYTKYIKDKHERIKFILDNHEITGVPLF